MIEDFVRWQKQWYKTIPKCGDFSCIHELTSCGVDRLCGDCTILEMWKVPKHKVICDDVGCEDCMRRYDCKMRKLEDVEAEVNCGIR